MNVLTKYAGALLLMLAMLAQQGCFQSDLNGNSPEVVLGDYVLYYNTSGGSIGGKVVFGLDKEPKHNYDSTEIVMVKNAVWRVPGCKLVDYNTTPEQLVFETNTNQVMVPTINFKDDCDAETALLSVTALAQVTDGYDTKTEYEKTLEYNLSIRNDTKEIVGNNPVVLLRQSSLFYASDYKEISGQIVFGLSVDPRNDETATETVTLDNFILKMKTCPSTFTASSEVMTFSEGRNQQLSPLIEMQAACFDSFATLSYRETRTLVTAFGVKVTNQKEHVVDLTVFSPVGDSPEDPLLEINGTKPNVNVESSLRYGTDMTTVSGTVDFWLDDMPESGAISQEIVEITDARIRFSGCETAAGTIAPMDFNLTGEHVSDTNALTTTVYLHTPAQCGDDKAILDYTKTDKIVAETGERIILQEKVSQDVTIYAKDGSDVNDLYKNEGYELFLEPQYVSLNKGGQQTITYTVKGKESGRIVDKVNYVLFASSDSNVSLINFKIGSSIFDYTGPSARYSNAPGTATYFSIIGGNTSGYAAVTVEVEVQRDDGAVVHETGVISVSTL